MIKSHEILQKIEMNNRVACNTMVEGFLVLESEEQVRFQYLCVNGFNCDVTVQLLDEVDNSLCEPILDYIFNDVVEISFYPPDSVKLVGSTGFNLDLNVEKYI